MKGITEFEQRLHKIYVRYEGYEKAAEQCLIEAIERAPHNRKCKFNLAYLYMAEEVSGKGFEEARKLFEQMVSDKNAVYDAKLIAKLYKNAAEYIAEECYEKAALCFEFSLYIRSYNLSAIDNMVENIVKISDVDIRKAFYKRVVSHIENIMNDKILIQAIEQLFTQIEEYFHKTDYVENFISQIKEWLAGYHNIEIAHNKGDNINLSQNLEKLAVLSLALKCTTNAANFTMRALDLFPMKADMLVQLLTICYQYPDKDNDINIAVALTYVKKAFPDNDVQDDILNILVKIKDKNPEQVREYQEKISDILMPLSLYYKNILGLNKDELEQHELAVFKQFMKSKSNIPLWATLSALLAYHKNPKEDLTTKTVVSIMKLMFRGIGITKPLSENENIVRHFINVEFIRPSVNEEKIDDLKILLSFMLLMQFQNDFVKRAKFWAGYMKKVAFYDGEKRNELEAFGWKILHNYLSKEADTRKELEEIYENLKVTKDEEVIKQLVLALEVIIRACQKFPPKQEYRITEIPTKPRKGYRQKRR